MSLFVYLAGLVLAGLASGAVAQPDIALLRRPANAAISLPLGQGLDLIHGAEPLGKGRFRLRLANRTNSVVVPDLGRGSSYTGLYGMAYGLRPDLDLSMLVPFLMDSVGGLAKYGTGDLVMGAKWARPRLVPARTYTSVQLLLGLPLGFKGETGLDQFGGGARPYSSHALDLGLQLEMDLHFRHGSMYLNGGFYRSGNPDILPQLVYGIGVESSRRQRRVHLNAEYQSRVAFSRQTQASGVLKTGVRVEVFRGVELELNREFGFLDYPYGTALTFGLRFHGAMAGGRRLESRYALYQPQPRPKPAYSPRRVTRLAVVDFAGFEEFQAGRRLVEKIKIRLEPHDSLMVVDLARYADIPKKGSLTPEQAADLARKLGVDAVVTGSISDYRIDRFSGRRVPYLFEVPQTQVEVDLRYRVLSFSGANPAQMETFTQQVGGQARVRQQVRLLPADQRDITVSASSGELEAIQEAALDDLAGQVLASMAAQFPWIPPDFLP
ncbi:MAG: hypothetical protein HYW07_20415 [Candidatus Latescibacteria bacterium]|nr:hypothetical protein [Candidatus Latescibacterota bacterium]